MKTTASILLVDDDAAFRHVMAGELRRMGHEIVTAASGEEAVARVEQREPEIVLLDLRLPGMDGLETLKAIRGRNASIEVIMLTAYETVDTIRRALRLGACDYLNKPFDIATIRKAVATAMERHSTATPW